MYGCKQFLIKVSHKINTRVKVYQHRYKSRIALSKLNTDQLKDIGLSKVQANHESSRPFWMGASDAYQQALIKRANAENTKNAFHSSYSHKKILEA